MFNKDIEIAMKSYDIILQLFSKAGFKAGTFDILCETPTSVTISVNQDVVTINFSGKFPILKINKFFTFKVSVSGLVLEKNNGLIKLENFPDIPFRYQANTSIENNIESSFETVFGTMESMDSHTQEIFGAIYGDIHTKYKEKKKRKFAEKCLQIGQEWTRIVSDDFSNYGRFAWASNSKAEKKTLKKECYQYIYDNLSKEDIHSFIPIWLILLSKVIISTVIHWIVSRIIEKMLK